MTIVAVPEGAIRPLIRERDTEIREKSILSVKKSLESGFKPGKGAVGKGVVKRSLFWTDFNTCSAPCSM